MASSAAAMISPFGGTGTGADPLGHKWSITSNAWGEPGLLKGTLSFNPAGNSDVTGNTWANRFSFIFLEGVDGFIDQTPASGPFGSEATTRFSDLTTGELWTTSFVGGNKVVFTAPTGHRLNEGDDFFVNIVFTGPVSVDRFSFAGLWTDAGGVPEPATWAMMLVGFGMIGMTTRRHRRGAVAA